MSGPNIDHLLGIWAADVYQHQATPPFASAADLTGYLDAIPHGDAPWQSVQISYSGPIADTPDCPSWMLKDYEVVYRDPRTVLRNQLENPDFANHFDCAPCQQFNLENRRKYKDFMSAKWVWKEAVRDCLPCLV